MPDWQYTNSGVINQDSQDELDAEGLVEQMIAVVKLARQAGGFSVDDVLFLVTTWTQIGQILRTRTYHQQIAPYWFMSGPENKSNKKTSERLQEELQKLSYHAQDADAEMHAIYFNNAEDAMRMFVSEYRSVAKTRDPDALRIFDGKLRHQAATKFL